MYAGHWYVSTAPTAEPLDLSEIRNHLLEVGGGRDDAIESYAKAARVALELWSGRQFMKATYTLLLDDFPSSSSYSAGSREGHILLPRPPLQSVTSVSYTDTDGDSQTVATTVYGVDTTSEPGRIYLKEGQSWPSDVLAQPQSVTVVYVAGYSSSATVATQRAAVPENVKHAIRLLTEHYFDMDTTKGITAAVESLLWSFRVMEFA